MPYTILLFFQESLRVEVAIVLILLTDLACAFSLSHELTLKFHITFLIKKSNKLPAAGAGGFTGSEMKIQ